MTCFRKFTTPLWIVFGGQLMMLLAIAFYIVWWTVSGGDVASAGTGSYLTVTLLSGASAAALLLFGITVLPQTETGIPVRYITAGALALLIALLPVTTIALHRTLTTELPLIIFWTALECSVIAALHKSRVFNVKKSVALVAVVAATTIVGLACYLVHYHLDEAARFRNGLIPLVADGVAMAAMLAAMAFSRVDRRSAVRE